MQKEVPNPVRLSGESGAGEDKEVLPVLYEIVTRYQEETLVRTEDRQGQD